jgi:hypothetical protein
LVDGLYKIEKPNTAPNRTVYAAGAVAPLACVRLGQSLRSIPTAHSGTFCQPWTPLRGALIWAGKTSYTAGTLCAIFLKFVAKLLTMQCQQVKELGIEIYYRFKQRIYFFIHFGLEFITESGTN